MRKTYKMIDGNNNVFTSVHHITAYRFFRLHGGNSVLIIDPDGKKEKFEKLPDGRIIKID